MRKNSYARHLLCQPPSECVSTPSKGFLAAVVPICFSLIKRVFRDALNKTQTFILKEIDKKPEITIDELSKLISVETRTIERNIRQLKEKNLLERKGSDKNGEWVIKK